MQKLVFIDVETTGIDYERCGITQISGAIQIGDTVHESFDYYLRPYPTDQIEEAALAVTGIDRRQFLPASDPNALKLPGQLFEDPQVIYQRLVELLGKHVNKFDKADKFQFIGYNAHSFDMPFMRKFWEKNGDRYFGSWFWYPCLDVMLLWAQILQPVREELSNFKLMTIAAYAGIEVDQSRLHDSQYDIELTRTLWLSAKQIIERGGTPLQKGEQGKLFDF
ncbi:MAG: 3'-5' exonuclease [Desulfuromonadales bacterium]|nr:3'-5' exonuclease [Desulfuromonadales bacterium]